ncbi:MAG: hypothetical protein K6F01_00725 [Selenomonas sp.]|nr:hypothetical protein [Selenomonas sp.]MCR5437972.1 hypothetical protein [Selenomonas sp.]
MGKAIPVIQDREWVNTMALQNKLGIMDSIELAHEEERLTKGAEPCPG